MTLRIKADSLPGSAEDFASHVAAYAAAMTEYAAHLKGVAEDAVNEALSPNQRRVAFPPPTADERVMRAVRQAEDGSYIADYEIAGPSIEERKAALLERVRAEEAKAIAAILPPAKVRHFQFRMADINAADAKRIADNPNRIDDIATFLVANRPVGDTAFLADYAARQARVGEVQRWAAKLEHDIDDLTEETIGGFVVTPFNG